MKIFRTRIKYIFVLAAVLTLSLFVFFTGCGEKKVTSPIDFVADNNKDEEELPLDPSTVAFNETMCRLIAKGTNCDLTVGLGDKSVTANITIAFYYKDIFVSLDLPAGGESVKVDVQFTANGQFIFLEAFGQKVVYNVKDTAEVVARLTALLTGGETANSGVDEILNMVLPVLEELDMLEILPMIPALVGQPRMGGGFSYVLNIADGISVVMNVNEDFTFDLIELQGISLGKKELVVKLNGFTEDYEIPATCNPEDYSNALDYLALLENLCEEYDIPVKDLVEYFKNSDFGKLTAFVNAVMNTKTLGATLDVEVGGYKIKADVTLDFSESLKLRAAISALGTDLDVYYSENNIYVVKDSLAVKTDFDGIGKLMALFAGEGGGISMPAADIEFKSIKLNNKGIAVDLGSIKLTLDLVNLKFGVNAFGADIAAELREGEKVTVPELDYANLNDLIGIAEKLKGILDNKAVLLNGSIDVQGATVEVENLNVSFDSGVSLSGGVKATVGGKEISVKAVYVGGDLYLSVAGINIKLGKAALNGIVKMGTELLNNYGTGLLDATEVIGGDLDLNELFGYLASFDTEADTLALNVCGAELTVKLDGDKIYVEATGEGFNVSLSVSEGVKDIAVPNGIYLEIGADVIDLLSRLDFDNVFALVADVTEKKYLGANINVRVPDIKVGGTTVNGFDVDSSATLDFGEGFKLALNLSLFGPAAEVYYVNGTVYLKIGGIAFAATVEELTSLIGEFAPDLKLDTSALGGVELKNIYAVDGKIAVDLGMLTIKADMQNLAFEVEIKGVSAKISNISVTEGVTVPDYGYIKLSDLSGLISFVKTVMKDKKLTVNGALTVKDTAVTLNNIAVNFDSALEAGGSAEVNMKGSKIAIDFAYVNGDAYLSVFGMNFKIGEAALKEFMPLIKNALGKLGNVNTTTVDVAKIVGYVGGVTLGANTVTAALGDLSLTVSATEAGVSAVVNYEGVSANIDVSTGAGEISTMQNCVEITPDVAKLIAKLDLQKVMDLVKSVLGKKSVSLTLGGNVGDIKLGGVTLVGTSLGGGVTVDFAKGLKVYAKLTAFGTEVEVYFMQTKTEDSIVYDLYLFINGMAFHTTLADLTDFINKFVTLDTGSLKNIDIKNIAADGDNIAVNLGNFIVKADLNKLAFGVATDGVSLTINGINAGEQINVPEVTYNELNPVYEIVDKIYGQFSEKQFAINGSFVIGDTTVILDNVRISDKGTGTVTENFDAGLLDIAGSVGLYLNGRTPADGAPDHGFDVTFFENNLYATYKHGTSESPRHTAQSAMNIKFNRSSLDNILAKVMENIETIANMFMPSGAYESLMSADTKKIDLSVYLGYLTELSTAGNSFDIKIDASAFNLGNIDISLVNGGENVLALGLVSETMNVNLALTANEVDITAPNGEFMDLSNIEHLVEGLLVTATKDSKQFVLSGTAGFKFSSSKNDTISLGIKLFITHGKETAVNENGETTEKTKLDIRLEIDAVPPKLAGTYATATFIHAGLMEFGRSVVWFNGEGIYARRQAVALSWGVIPPKFDASNDKYYKSPEYKYLPLSECSGKTLTNFICYILGFKGSIKDAIVNAETAPMDYAQLLKVYSVENSKHNIKLNMLELINNKSFNDLDLALTLGENNYVTVIGVNMGIAGILDVRATLNHNPEENVPNGYIYDGFDNNYTKYVA